MRPGRPRLPRPISGSQTSRVSPNAPPRKAPRQGLRGREGAGGAEKGRDLPEATQPRPTRRRSSRPCADLPNRDVRGLPEVRARGATG